MKHHGKELPFDPGVLLRALKTYAIIAVYDGPEIPGGTETLSSRELIALPVRDEEDTWLWRALMLAWQAGIVQGRALEARQQARKAAREERLREALAAYAHEAWAGWMTHMFGECTDALRYDADDRPYVEIRMPYELHERWHRQRHTPYAEMSETERASDRAQADRILAILRGEG